MHFYPTCISSFERFDVVVERFDALVFVYFIIPNLSDYCFGIMYNIPVYLYLRSNLTARAPGCHFYPTCISSFERFDAYPFLTTILFSYYSLTMASRATTALSKISSWGRSGLSSISSRCRLPSWMKKAHDHFPPHPGIERNQLRGIFQYEYTEDEAQYFSFIGETRNDDPHSSRRSTLRGFPSRNISRRLSRQIRT